MKVLYKAHAATVWCPCSGLESVNGVYLHIHLKKRRTFKDFHSCTVHTFAVVIQADAVWCVSVRLPSCWVLWKPELLQVYTIVNLRWQYLCELALAVCVQGWIWLYVHSVLANQEKVTTVKNLRDQGNLTSRVCNTDKNKTHILTPDFTSWRKGNFYNIYILGTLSRNLAFLYSDLLCSASRGSTLWKK